MMPVRAMRAMTADIERRAFKRRALFDMEFQKGTDIVANEPTAPRLAQNRRAVEDKPAAPVSCRGLVRQPQAIIGRPPNDIVSARRCVS